MKTVLFAFTALLFLASCSKKDQLTPPVVNPEPNPSPAMKHLDLGNTSVGFGKLFVLDIDGNGSNDFYVSTVLIGSPVDQRDYQSYLFSGSFYSYSPVNMQEEMPVLAKGEWIGDSSFPNYEWYNASQLMLGQRVIPINGEPYWRGGWIDANHRYVPISILKDTMYYYGWVELSFDRQQAAVILHKAAVSLEPGVQVKAGY